MVLGRSYSLLSCWNLNPIPIFQFFLFIVNPSPNDKIQNLIFPFPSPQISSVPILPFLIAYPQQDGCLKLHMISHMWTTFRHISHEITHEFSHRKWFHVSSHAKYTCEVIPNVNVCQVENVEWFNKESHEKFHMRIWKMRNFICEISHFEQRLIWAFTCEFGTCGTPSSCNSNSIKFSSN